MNTKHTPGRRLTMGEQGKHPKTKLPTCGRCIYFKPHKPGLPKNRIVAGDWVGDGKCIYLEAELNEIIDVPVEIRFYTVEGDTCHCWEASQAIAAAGDRS